VVSSVVGGCSVEDACGGAAEVVGAEVSEVGGVGSLEDDAADGAGLGDAVAP